MRKEHKEKVIREAVLAKVNSYSPYSKFRVGAAVITKEGEIIQGSNIEISSYPCGICAERSALFGAYSKGYRKDDIEALAISSDAKDFITPCGLCCQVICELMNSEAPVFLLDSNENVKEIKVKKFLPYLFNLKETK